MSSSELFSHPGNPPKLLISHLEEVSKLCRETISNKRINFPDIDNATLENTAFILGACHDFGKATRFFQEYIKEGDEKSKLSLKNKPQTKHGMISAVFTYFALKESLKGHTEDYSYLPIFGFLAVKRHHGNLNNPAFELVELNEDTSKVLLDQINAIDRSKISGIYKVLLPGIDLSKFSENIESILDEIRRSRRNLTAYLENKKSLSTYILFQLLYSTLINSDKMEASGLRQQSKKEISSEIVDKYKMLMGWDKSTDKINTIRNSIYLDVNSNAENLNLEDKIFSLNVPTGTGKTLTSFSLALKLREKIRKLYGFSPKIIYSLPFLSIIDQNFNVFDEVFETVNGQKPTTDVLLKHHHLSDTFYSTRDDEFKEDKALFLIEGWNSEIIVTTFVQLFHTMISNKNRALRKFHNLANSIVILDEVQSIPHEYWWLLRNLISEISICFNTYFIFVTATQPLIFDEKEIIELVTNKKHYFDQFDRIKLQYFQESIAIEDFKKLVTQDVEKYADKSFLIVLNTINSTKELYTHLISQKTANTEYYYLSTNIIPKQRLERICSIRESKKRKIIVSTQLIEAGVDIDVDIVYRDMAPLDSINQVAGRCNRNYGEGKKGEVGIFTIKDNKQEYHKYIYSSFLIDKTKEVLKGTNVIHEGQFLNLNNSYFQKVKDTQSNDKAKVLLEYLSTLRFDFLQKEFHLIENEYEKVDLFIELDSVASEVWKKYRNIREIKNPIERKNKFLDIKKQFYEYVISIPKSKAPPIFDAELGIGYISQDDLKFYYDKETGFFPSGGGVMIF